jgi:hypothetical protein
METHLIDWQTITLRQRRQHWARALCGKIVSIPEEETKPGVAPTCQECVTRGKELDEMEM